MCENFGSLPLLGTILSKSPTTHKIHLLHPLNFEIYRPKQGSILRSCLCHTLFYAIKLYSRTLCIMTYLMSVERECGTRVGHIQYFRDCPTSFRTVGNYLLIMIHLILLYNAIPPPPPTFTGFSSTSHQRFQLQGLHINDHILHKT